MGEWSHKPCSGLPGNQYEVTVDGKLAGTVELFPSMVARPANAIRAIVAALAKAEGGTVAAASMPHRPEVDWRGLGWADQAEHDQMLAEVHRQIDSWAGHRLEQQLIAHVHAEKLAAGLPHRPPFSVEELDELDQIIRRTPHIVLQDVAAEGAAA